MSDIPNARHSKYVEDLCQNFNLIDPYRGFFPNRRDYTFIPKNVLSTNRSRIDFFLTSTHLFNMATLCDITPHLQSKLFDHKATLLDFYPKKNTAIRGPMISNFILSDPDIEIVVFVNNIL